MIKTNLLIKSKVAVCSETHTRHVNAMWAPRRIFWCYTQWYITLALGFKRLMYFFRRAEISLFYFPQSAAYFFIPSLLFRMLYMFFLTQRKNLKGQLWRMSYHRPNQFHFKPPCKFKWPQTSFNGEAWTRKYFTDCEKNAVNSLETDRRCDMEV
jgi:hypothetical protein